MGFSLSWVAVKGATPAAVQSALQLRVSGSGAVSGSKCVGASISGSGSWYLIVSQRDGLDLLDDQTASRLSHLGETVVCYVEEHAMVSSAACWRDGRQIWYVLHDSGEGDRHLSVEGDPPDNFAVIRDSMLAMQAAEGGDQAGVDYIFDVPIELAQSLTGYRHDGGTGCEYDEFVRLVPIA